MFSEFWAKYPRRVARGAAEKAYVKALEKCQHEEIMAGLDRFLENLDRDTPERKFIAHASTWLNQQRWTDEYRDYRAKTLTPPDNSEKVSFLKTQLDIMAEKEKKYGFSLEKERQKIEAQLAVIEG